MRKFIGVAVASVLLLVSLACSALGGSSGRSGSEVTIVNRSPDDVCYVYISSTESDDWGESWLAGDQVISAGDTAKFDIDKGTYDVQVEDCGGAVMGVGWEFTGDYTLTVGGAGRTVRVLLENDLETEICYVFISPSTGDDWGDDWMSQAEQVPPGGRRMFYVAPGTYDMRADDCNENTLVEEYEMDLSEDTTWNLFNE